MKEENKNQYAGSDNSTTSEKEYNKQSIKDLIKNYNKNNKMENLFYCVLAFCLQLYNIFLILCINTIEVSYDVVGGWASLFKVFVTVIVFWIVWHCYIASFTIGWILAKIQSDKFFDNLSKDCSNENQSLLSESYISKELIIKTYIRNRRIVYGPINYVGFLCLNFILENVFNFKI